MSGSWLNITSTGRTVKTYGQPPTKDVNLRAPRRRIADLITVPTCGRIISRLFDDRIPTHGCTLDTSSPLISPDTKAQLFWGLYERTEIRFALRYLRNDLDVVELGSSIGMIGSLLARRLCPPCRMVCVEAHPGLARVVARNISRNAPTARLTVLNRAIDYAAKSGFSYLKPSAWSHSGKVVRGETGIRIRNTTLTEILREQEIGEYILVADIEGAEAGLLLEDGDALAKCRQLVIELHNASFRDNWITSEQMARLLAEEHGFTLLENYGAVYAFARTPVMLETRPNLSRIAPNAS
jgi:FkbM family methyltransferase